ncbi:MAG: T9SS type A sorting domain-containing protein [Flavobacteriales bacterium]|nr:T9SS type A sorting domain-containing protein [Flavobacteriales bacterium]
MNTPLLSRTFAFSFLILLLHACAMNSKKEQVQSTASDSQVVGKDLGDDASGSTEVVVEKPEIETSPTNETIELSEVKTIGFCAMVEAVEEDVEIEVMDMNVGVTQALPMAKNGAISNSMNLRSNGYNMTSSGGSDVLVGYDATHAPGQLTAGEIHDFSKWKLWEDISKNELGLFQQQWQMYPSDRYCTAVQNDNGDPIVGAEVKLLDGNGAVVWTSMTDNTGKAELWNGFFANTSSGSPAKISVSYKGKTKWIEKIRPIDKGINSVKLTVPCGVSDAVDILWCVDATGSMGDEIDYLKAELQDIIAGSSDRNPELDIRTGSVFYRCQGNSFTTRKSPFTKDIAVTSQFIRQQSAEEGGVEAVEIAMDEAINQFDWRKEARAKIMFMVLDECPGREAEVIARVHEAARSASAKGIRIVPLVSSGVDFSDDKSLEYLMRSLALATNGTYAFLTDHSGIGSSHTAPSTNKYKVEKLNALLLRIIEQYTYYPECDADASVELTDPAEVVTVPEGVDMPDMKLWPNPARIEVNVEVSEVVDELVLTDNAGKLMLRKESPALRTAFDVTDFPSGMYFVRARKGTTWMKERLVVAR